VGAVLGGYQALGELLVVHADRPAALAEQRLHFTRGHQAGDLVEDPLGEKSPVEGVASDAVAVVASAELFLGNAPAASAVEEGFEPVLPFGQRLAHAGDGFVGRGELPGTVFRGVLGDGLGGVGPRHTEPMIARVMEFKPPAWLTANYP